MVVSSVVAATAFALLSLPSVSARLLSSLSELETTYDFVVVGGGNAGSVVANRLTENENFKVLVVEAGVNNEGLLGMEIPFLASSQFGTGVDWNFSTVPQPGVNDKSLHVAKGFALGGDTSLNVFLWYRGSNDIWDHYARLTGDDNWSWDSMAEYYKKTSRIVAPTNGRDISGDFIPDAHGDGPVQVTLNGVVLDIDNAVYDVAQEAEGKFAFNPDYNSGQALGLGWGQVTTGGGSRSSAATAYLQPAINRPNLDVIVNTYVTRLFSSTSDDGTPVMDTVQLASGTNGPFVNVTASNEIVLSAGSINSPKILMLSGIGPQEELSSFDIPVLVDSPAVGANMTEHPIVFNVYSLNSTSSYDDVLRLPALQEALLGQWQSNMTGLYANAPGGTVLGNFKLPEGSEDPSSGPGSANIMIALFDGFFKAGQPATGNFVTVLTSVLSPTSRGSLKLASSDPFEKPLIDYGLFSTDFDIKAIVEAMKTVKELFSQPQLSEIVEGPFGDLANATTDEALADFARANIDLYSHPSGSLRMGPGADAVVDTTLKVKGVKGLRVVDTSVVPQIPECNTQAIVYMLAEKASDLIKSDYQ